MYIIEKKRRLIHDHDGRCTPSEPTEVISRTQARQKVAYKAYHFCSCARKD
ncbi:hypothetical protein [Natribacillus halophilus]|uniref:Uncharacterized protein n=1 Tax=Natribacillus halophilus TaxID=549003 RepID=A0A1G8LPZ5_9BACI|nr:hypothetical protein [Natribacillus halophilus]SDI57758.1 hypothetical protein SAMN04488123_103210 [Natribacillus halophilus]